MEETRIFIEIIKHENGRFVYSVGGGECVDGQMEQYDTIDECVREIKIRAERDVELFNNK